MASNQPISDSPLGKHPLNAPNPAIEPEPVDTFLEEDHQYIVPFNNPNTLLRYDDENLQVEGLTLTIHESTTATILEENTFIGRRNQRIRQLSPVSESDTDYFLPVVRVAEGQPVSEPLDGLQEQYLSGVRQGFFTVHGASPILRNLNPAHAMTATSPARTGVSPSSSPRLPSPPPFTEVQIGPTSPTVGDMNSDFQLGDSVKTDEGAARRIRPGTKAADMASGPPLVPLNQLESPFQLQEHLKALYYSLTRGADPSHTIPINKETARRLAQPPQTSDTGETVDKNLWLYELCRFLTMKANDLIVGFFELTPPCSVQTCPEMRASEWQYLCAVHDPPKSCAAIDYCCHTLDWASNILTSPKHFASRLTLGGETSNVSNSMRQLTNIFRRVYRIFAHAWFQHREVFWNVESSEGVYIFFKTVCDVYALIPEDSYTIPAEAEGPRDDEEETPVKSEIPDLNHRMQIMTKTIDGSEQENGHESQSKEGSTTTTVSVGATTRRHKHTPSTGSHVTTIAEGTEEELDEESPHTYPGLSHAGQSFVQTQVLPSSSSGPDLSKGLGKLHLGASNMPTFDLRVPEDPTPTIHDHEVDPFAATSPSPEPPSPERDVKTDSAVAQDGPKSQEAGSSGGVLDQILGHMDELEKPTPAAETSIASSSSPKKQQVDIERLEPPSELQSDVSDGQFFGDQTETESGGWSKSSPVETKSELETESSEIGKADEKTNDDNEEEVADEKESASTETNLNESEKEAEKEKDSNIADDVDADDEDEVPAGVV